MRSAIQNEAYICETNDILLTHAHHGRIATLNDVFLYQIASHTTKSQDALIEQIKRAIYFPFFLNHTSRLSTANASVKR